MATTSAANADPAREVTFFELGHDILAASGKHDPRNGISIGTMWMTVHDDAQQLFGHNGTVRRYHLGIIDGVDDLLEREVLQNSVPIWEALYRRNAKLYLAASYADSVPSVPRVGLWPAMHRGLERPRQRPDIAAVVFVGVDVPGPTLLQAGDIFVLDRSTSAIRGGLTRVTALRVYTYKADFEPVAVERKAGSSSTFHGIVDCSQRPAQG